MANIYGSCTINGTATLTGSDLLKRFASVDISPLANFNRANATIMITASVSMTGEASVTAEGIFTVIMGTADIEADSVKIIAQNLNNAKTRFFIMNDLLYIINGREYLVYDGKTVKNVEDNAYAPKLIMGRKPNGTGGNVLEQWNMLGSGFRESYSADGSSKIYKLSQKELDSTEVKAEVNAVVKLENIDFTVNRASGEVTFNVAPSEGTDNVIITAYKTFKDKRKTIKKCTNAAIYGGGSGTRVFLFGHPENKNTMYRSDLSERNIDPSYFPENKFIKVGYDSEKIMGANIHYDILVIHKEFSKWSMNYELDVEGNAIFPIKPINSSVGCIAEDSLQLVNNNATALTGNGVFALTTGTVKDERNVSEVSNNIDTLLLKEKDLYKAISIDYKNKYILGLNDKCYINDYRQNAWYIYDNVPASSFIEINQKLYFGSNKEGLLYRFKERENIECYSDDGEAIKATWTGKLYSFDSEERRKMIDRIFFTLRPDIRASASLYYRTDSTSEKFIEATRKDLFDYGYIDYDYFSYLTSIYPQEVPCKVKAKDVGFMQLKFENNNLNEGMGILSIGIKYMIQEYFK